MHSCKILHQTMKAAIKTVQGSALGVCKKEAGAGRGEATGGVLLASLSPGHRSCPSDNWSMGGFTVPSGTCIARVESMAGPHRSASAQRTDSKEPIFQTGDSRSRIFTRVQPPDRHSPGELRQILILKGREGRAAGDVASHKALRQQPGSPGIHCAR